MWSISIDTHAITFNQLPDTPQFINNCLCKHSANPVSTLKTMKHSPKKLEFFGETCTSLEIFSEIRRRRSETVQTSPLSLRVAGRKSSRVGSCGLAASHHGVEPGDLGECVFRSCTVVVERPLEVPSGMHPASQQQDALLVLDGLVRRTTSTGRKAPSGVCRPCPGLVMVRFFQ